MSRDIKFRAWDKEAKAYFYNAEHTYDFGCMGQGGMAESFGEVLDNPEYYIVEQFTGLKDKNNKEIFEGDIITETIDDGDTEVRQTYEVYWDEDLLLWAIRGVHGYDYNLHDELWQTNMSREVIGNVHETTGLVGGD